MTLHTLCMRTWDRIDAELKRRHKGWQWLADELGYTIQRVNNWKRRDVPDDVYGPIADALHKSLDWVAGREPDDRRHHAPVKSTKSANMTGLWPGYSTQLSTGVPVTLLPVVQLQGLDMSQKNDAIERQSVDWLPTPGHFSERAKITAMPDDSMAPEIQAGELVAFDPSIVAEAGDTVLIGDEFGGFWIRKYRPLPGGKFDAIAMNDDHAPLRSGEHGVKVLAVMVGHWRGRRAKRH